MKTLLTTLAIGLAALAFAAEPTPSPDDRVFLEEAAKGGAIEVELGKIAADKGSNPEVKEFGKLMVADHSKVNAELATLAQKKQIPLPAKLDAENLAMIESMAALSGPEFDRRYVSGMLEDHRKDVQLFKTATERASDLDIQAYATKTLRVLEDHLERITALEKSL